MKKLFLSILCTIVLSAVVGVNSMLNIPTKEQSMEQLKQETKIEKVDEKIDTEDIAVKDEEIEEVIEKPSETEKNKKKETDSKSTVKPSSSVSDVPKQESTTKQESSSNSSNNTTTKSTQNIQQNEQQSSNTQSNSSGQTNKVSTSFYDSITGGKKEFSSESACFARGTQIQNAELDYVLNYNEQHPEAPIQPDINYFRCYPVIDEQGEGWYLHFFCRTGEGNDAKLKSMY